MWNQSAPRLTEYLLLPSIASPHCSSWKLWLFCGVWWGQIATSGFFSWTSNKPVHICWAVLVWLVERIVWMKCISPSIRSKNCFFWRQFEKLIVIYSPQDITVFINLAGSLFKGCDLWSILGEQGWHGGESARLPPMWPWFDSRSRCHMWVEFVVGSRPCSEGFSPGSPVFLPPQNQHFQIPYGISGRRATLWRCLCKFQFIYLFYFMWCSNTIVTLMPWESPHLRKQ